MTMNDREKKLREEFAERTVKIDKILHDELAAQTMKILKLLRDQRDSHLKDAGVIELRIEEVLAKAREHGVEIPTEDMT